MKFTNSWCDFNELLTLLTDSSSDPVFPFNITTARVKSFHYKWINEKVHNLQNIQLMSQIVLVWKLEIGNSKLGGNIFKVLNNEFQQCKLDA